MTLPRYMLLAPPDTLIKATDGKRAFAGGGRIRETVSDSAGRVYGRVRALSGIGPITPGGTGPTHACDAFLFKTADCAACAPWWFAEDRPQSR